MQILNVAVIGAGSSKGQDYVEALSQRSDVKIVACVINKNLPENIDKLSKVGTKIIENGDVARLIREVPFDIAVVSLPHHLHDPVTQLLLQANKSVVKEKPIALNRDIAHAYPSFKPIFTTVQRSTHPLFLEAKQDLQQIGEPTSFTYTYTFNLSSPTSGWRAEPHMSGGGVLIDMGYHILDVVLSFFGKPEKVSCSFGYKYSEMQSRRLEDSAVLTFSYPNNLVGTIILNRHADKKEEHFEINGSSGSIVLTPTTYDLSTQSNVKHKDNSLGKIQIIQAMFDAYFTTPTDSKFLDDQFTRNLDIMEIIDKAYAEKIKTLPPFSDQARSVKPGIYEHFKGLRYTLVSVGRHSETLEEYVVYRALYGDQLTWVRPLSLFLQFVTKDGSSFPRFRYLGDREIE